MDTEELKTYVLIKDDPKPILIFVLVEIALLLIYFLGFQKALDNSNGGLIYVAIAIIPLFYVFRTRTCSSCKTPMKKKSSALIPAVHYCEKCRNKVETPFVFV